MELRFSITRNKAKVNKEVYTPTNLPRNFLPIINQSVINRATFQKLYNENVDIASIVNYVSQICAETLLNAELYRNEKVIPNKYYDLFWNPNEFDTGFNFWKAAFVNFFINGNTFINKLSAVGFSGVTKLYLLNCSKVYPITNKSTDNYGTIPLNTDSRTLELTKYHELLDTAFVPYEVSEIIHIKDVNTESYILGKSRLTPALKNADILKFLDDTLQTVLGQSGALGFVKKTVRNNEIVGIDPNEKERIERNFYNYGVGGGKKPIFFTDQDLNYVRILTAINEFMPVEISDMEFKKICLAVGGVPDVLFKASDTTFTNLPEAQKMMYTNIVIPTVNMFLGQIEVGLGVEKNEEFRVDYSKIECLQEDKKTELEIREIEQRLLIEQYEKGIINLGELKKKLYE